MHNGPLNVHANGLLQLLFMQPHAITGNLTKWFSALCFESYGISTRVGSNPFAGTTDHKPAANSALHPFEVGKSVLKGQL